MRRVPSASRHWSRMMAALHVRDRGSARISSVAALVLVLGCSESAFRPEDAGTDLDADRPAPSEVAPPGDATPSGDATSSMDAC